VPDKKALHNLTIALDWFRWFQKSPTFDGPLFSFMFMGEAWNPEKVCYPGCDKVLFKAQISSMHGSWNCSKTTLKCKLIVLEEGQ